ncbi:uncharacterized protein Tco025E_06244 [Trypanosoma conorhini]|uniref:Uncharacterized protein n=1 Tax=Trypanosoma conorhini TaxID=83891 RepID=A0A3R7MYM9_9TRYP|nr:uncharacterized protein Tco025E_06244 [Trypanosoma conorhini]RNF13276.1 hypothetical protein Tco025E_06244 [Trypanosoma conorhini]
MSDAAPPQFTEEDATVLDRWIADVCGEEVQFPAHRRAQFSAYKQRLELIRESGAQSLFRHSSRSGTQETLALHKLLAALNQLCRCDMEEMASVRDEIGSVERMLHGSAVVGEGKAAAAPSPAAAAAGDAASAAGSSLEAYESRRKLAACYVAEIEHQRQSNRANMASCHARHLRLLDQRDQLQEELNALRETEEFVASRLEETRAALASERDAAAREQREQPSNTCAAAQDGGDVKDEAEEENAKALAELRASLNSACHELAQTRAELSSQDTAHAVRFRQARQRLKDWQDMVGQMRRTCDQLCSRTRVIGTVVEANVAGLVADSGLGYAGQLRKLNRLLVEKSARLLGLQGGAEEEEDNEVVSAAGGGGVLRELFIPHHRAASSASVTEAASSLSSPLRRSSLSSASPQYPSAEASSLSVPGGAGSTNAPQQTLARQRRHRRAYALLTDLRRWEMALVKESAVLHGICERGLRSAPAPSPSGSPSTCIRQLRSLLLATQ